MRGTRRQRWTWFLLLCIGLGLLGRLQPIQFALLGVGLVAIGVAVLSTQRFHRPGH
jgi:hypothetical protein